MEPVSKSFLKQFSRLKHRLLIRVLIVLTSILIITAVIYSTYSQSASNNPVTIAVVMPLSGSLKEVGQEIMKSISLRVNEVNAAGGIMGHRVKIVSYDDKGDENEAAKVAQSIAASPAVAVIGNFTSNCAIKAGPIYNSSQIPAITASADAPSVTADNPYYFRISADAFSQGHTSAAYAVKVLGLKRARVLYSDDIYGRSWLASFSDEFAEQGGTVEQKWAWKGDGSDKEHADVIKQTADAIAQGSSGVLILAIAPYNQAKNALTLLRRTGVDPTIIGSNSLGNSFPSLFANEPEEKETPGFFTHNTYINSSILFDSTTPRALAFFDLYQHTYHNEPDDRSAEYYEAASIVEKALQSAPVQLTSQSINDDRKAIRDWLESQNNGTQALPGLTGPVYFDETHSRPQAVRMGRCVEGRIVSAPVQLAAVPNPSLIDLDAELAAGRVIRIRQSFYWLQRVVYTGIDINQISSVDPSKGTFTADFYLWFRYSGDNSLRNVDFNSANDKSPYDPSSPLLDQTINGLHYSLYRVRGDFQTDYDFHDYPFDRQSLVLNMTNPRLTCEQVIYAIDTFGLKLPRTDGGVSQLSVANWDFTKIRYISDAITSQSTRGQPGSFHSNLETGFSVFQVMIDIKRRTFVYLIKNLLPLLLLVLVVYVTLYFPMSLAAERITTSISALLASAVLLISINTQLPDVGYTTAIEYGFYAFFGLCIYCVIVGLITERLHSHDFIAWAQRFDIAARIIYPVITLLVFLAYYVHYSA